MAYLETAIGLSVKEIFEFLVVIISFILVYFSYKTYLNLKNKNSLFTKSFKLIGLGFMFFALSMLFELIDSFYLDYIFDKVQLVFGIIAFIILFVGFKKGFEVSSGGKNA